MKTTILILVFIFLSFGLKAQFSPESFVLKIPNIPSNICKEEVKEKFKGQVSDLRDELSTEISRRKIVAKNNTKGFDEQASKNMMKQQGMSVSDADIQKMKTASKEEKRAMAEKMMQRNMNMSIEEAQKASKMSDAGKKAWAEGMSTEMMADAQANPDKNKAAQKNNMNMFEIVQEQSRIAEKIQAEGLKFDKQLEEYNQLKEKKKKEYDACMAPIAKERASRPNKNLGTDSHPDLDKKEEACYQAYCSFLMEKYTLILNERFSIIEATAKDYNRMDELTNALASATSGAKKEINEPGLTYLEELNKYLQHLQDLP